MTALAEKAAKNLSGILKDSLLVVDGEEVMVIYDLDSELSRTLTEGYRAALPNGIFVDFNEVTPEEIISKVYALKPKDTVVLVQSKSFRLNEFRFRIELFQRELKTIEHIHLGRMQPDQHEIYVDALAYDKEYYHTTGHALKAIIEKAEHTVVSCHGGTTLVYESPMEDAKLNIGDYSQMKNVGGTFPIGEVFTEPKDLTKVNGEAMVFAFADTNHIVHLYDPFKVYIKEGVLTAGEDAPKAFHELLELIRADEEVTIREFGMSLNPAMSKTRMVSDITAFERMRGLHVSLGAKHTIYAKAGFHRKKSRYHIDVFFDVSSIKVDGREIFNGELYVTE